jgi:hypothetical protein
LWVKSKQAADFSRPAKIGDQFGIGDVGVHGVEITRHV